MNWKLMIMLCMVVGLLAVGCQSNQPPTGYYSYNGQGGAQQPQGGQYVGGGCGVAAADGDAVDVSTIAASA